MKEHDMSTVRIDTSAYVHPFVFIPSCCYDGNKFEVLKKNYPPMFDVSEARIDMPVTITDVPRLEKDGSGKIEVTTGDAATPCIGVFSQEINKAVLIFTIQEINGLNIGIAYENSEIRLTYPAKREKCYVMTSFMENNDPMQDMDIDIPYKTIEFDCHSISELYTVFFENRKIMGADCSRPNILSYEQQLTIQMDKFNAMNWRESPGFYSIGTNNDKYQVWQPGWVGGAISSYPLMKLGGEVEWGRGVKTLDFLFSTQTASGLFISVIDSNGTAYGDGFDTPGTEKWHLIRKSADVLYFIFKHFALFEAKAMDIPEEWLAATRKLADRFVKIWRKYHQFGQFIDEDTGEMIVGGSTCAAIAPAGLVKAFQFFGDDAYLKTAKESAEDYYINHLAKGYTTGGPCEILQCADSESAFGLLESFVCLYEQSKDEKWLVYAEECLNYSSSWVVSYNYVFPPRSQFGILNMKTVGSVFANLQNKHSAPALCTLSGDSIYKLYQWTKNPKHLEFFKDVVLTTSQYMSTNERPIYDWDISAEELANGDHEKISKHRLPQGFMCERVNMSDWESERCVGGVFNGSCWCEVSNMLELCESYPLLHGADEGSVC